MCSIVWVPTDCLRLFLDHWIYVKTVSKETRNRFEQFALFLFAFPKICWGRVEWRKLWHGEQSVCENLNVSVYIKIILIYIFVMIVSVCWSGIWYFDKMAPGWKTYGILTNLSSFVFIKEQSTTIHVLNFYHVIYFEFSTFFCFVCFFPLIKV